VWGVATVKSSKNSHFKVGEKIYGYFPIAKYYCLSPINVNSVTFYVSRKHLPEDRIVYSQYFRQDGDSEYSALQEDHMIIFRPLWGTAYFLDDYLNENKFFNGENVLISSASSKTAYCLAILLKKRNKNIIALTSARNINFIKGLALYNQIFDYNHIEKMDKVSTLYVDLAGNSSLNERIYRCFENHLVKRVAVGMSHFDKQKPSLIPLSQSTANSHSVTFFAPDWIKKRSIHSKHELIIQKIPAWKEFLAFANERVPLNIRFGMQNTKSVYLEMLHGKADPQNAFILSLWDKSKL
jgi:hypothetical protein